MSVSLTGSDSISIGAFGAQLRIMSDMADGDVGMLDFPNNIVEGKVGKNGNTIFALNTTGKQATLSLRVILGSADDKFLNAEMNRYLLDPPSYTLLAGEIVKRVGDGQGNVSNLVYPMSGGIIQKIPTVKDNVEGDTEQAVAVYTLFFANNERAIA